MKHEHHRMLNAPRQYLSSDSPSGVSAEMEMALREIEITTKTKRIEALLESWEKKQC